MSARERLAERLAEQLRNPGLVGLDEEEAAELIDAFAHELAEQQRAALEHGPGADWDYETGRSLADLIDPSAGPVRPDEEPTTPNIKGIDSPDQ